jgi:predicted permease
MPPGFLFPSHDGDVWWPMGEDDPVAGARSAHTFRAFGRLKPGVLLSEAQAEMNVIAERLEAQYPDHNTDVRYTLVPLLDSVVGPSGQALWLLFGAVGVVLLIACANVANLILVRTGARQQETAVRMALGASRRRLMRQWLTEIMLLFLAGGTAGLALAYWLLPALLALSPDGLPRLEEIGLDWRVMGFTLGLTVLAGALFSLQPAWSAGKVEVANSLRDGGGTSAGRKKRWFANAMIVTEVALALVLLAGAGLLVRTFSHLLSQEPGFHTQRLMTFSFSLSQEKFKDIPRRTRFFQEVIERLNGVPGVESVAATTDMPFYPGYYIDHNSIIEGQPDVPLGETPSLVARSVNPDYHRALGIPLKAGRYLSAQDRTDTFPVAMINEAAVRRFFPSEDPIGKRFRWAFADEVRWMTIVGVVGDVRDFGLHTEDRPAAYYPFAQEQNWWRSWMLFAVRTTSADASLIPAVKAAVKDVDSGVAVADFWSMDKLLEDSYGLRRFSLQLLGGFALVALILTVIGIYGVIAQSARQRTHEIGLRMALGARKVDVLRLILTQGFRLALMGVGLGLLGSLGLTRLLQNLLFGVSPTDPLTFAGVTILLFSVALLACLIPARRAAQVDPMVALRYE